MVVLGSRAHRGLCPTNSDTSVPQASKRDKPLGHKRHDDGQSMMLRIVGFARTADAGASPRSMEQRPSTRIKYVNRTRACRVIRTDRPVRIESARP